jgi:phosphatidylinositol N-acetylglucosaminyltransferase subunit H
MRPTRPFVDHPEFLVLDTPDLCREYRVENWHLARDGSKRVVRSASPPNVWDALIVLMVALVWPLVRVAVSSLLLSNKLYRHAHV